LAIPAHPPDPKPGEPSETAVEFPDNRLLIELCGEFDRNLVRVEDALGVQIARRGNQLSLIGGAAERETAARLLSALYERLEQGKPVEAGDVDAALRFGPAPSGADALSGPAGQLEMFKGARLEIKTRKRTVEPRTRTQRAYVEALFGNELCFGVGPAGTGKTYLAVAVAVSMFLDGQVDRIILSRPAVEAGERLGFLPGDMREKVDPFMQPLYDALHDFLPGKQLAGLMEDKRIEIAPLAFMRGRTLSRAFVVLDEAQNATAMQMKMFLTRMGEGARMAITGDASQIDLPRGVTSGLVEAERVLREVQGISFTYFTAADVVRHPLVARIIEAYDDSPHGG
jgi:phosphate starvation-inducible PhoH-like protein